MAEVRPHIRKAWDDAIVESVVKYDPAQDPDVGISTIKPPRKQVGGPTLLGKIIDVLSRGEYASANMARDYILNKPFDLESAKKGIRGEEKTTYDDLVPQVFPHYGKWKRMAMSFALAVFADPTTYIPFGAIAKGVQKGGRAVIKTKPGQRVAKAVDDSLVSKAFRPEAGLPTAYYEKKYYAKKALEAEKSRILKDVDELRKGLNKRDMKDLMFYREHPEMHEFMRPELKAKLDEIGKRFDEQLQRGVDDGIISPDVAKKWMEKDVPYAPHYYPERGIKIASGEIPPSLFEKVKKPSFMKKRVFNTIEDAKRLSGDFADVAKSKTLDEAQDKIRRYGFDELFSNPQFNNLADIKSIAGMRAKWYTPEGNLLKAYGIRAFEQAGYTARKKFVDDVLAEFGTKVKAGTKTVPEGLGLYYPKGQIRFFAKDVADADDLIKLIDQHGEFIPAGEIVDALKRFPSITKKVSAYALPEAIAKDMNKFNKFFIGDPATNKMLKVFDKAQNAWKTMATTIRLPFHLRNMYSNWWQIYIGGVDAAKLPSALLKSGAFQAGQMKNIKLGNKVYKYDELKTVMEDLGVVGKGWIGADIPQRYFGELESILKYGKLRKMNPVDAGRAFGTAVENNARIALFFDQVSKGKSFKEASQQVRKYLFDYSELTPFERNVMKRILPFYTWSRKNIPLQIENLLKQPLKYQRHGKALRAFEQRETPEELRLKARYFNEMMYIKSPFKTEQGKPVYMSLDVPPLEFNRMIEARHWLSSVSPFKLFAEVGLNLKTFPEISPIRRQPLEKTRAPFWVAYLPDRALRIMKDNHIIDTIVDKASGKTILGMDKMWAHAIQNAFPFMNELNRIHAQPIYIDDETPAMKFKSYVTGISRTALNLNLQREREAWEEIGKIKREEKFVIQHGRGATKKELEILNK